MTRFWIVMGAFVFAIFSIWLYAVGYRWRQELEALFSGLALVAITGTLWFQGRELRDAQDARKSQNEIMNKTALLQGYTAALNYHQAEQLSAERNPDPNVRAYHVERAKRAEERIDQLLRDIEELMKREHLPPIRS